jgi:hypothetical protein
MTCIICNNAITYPLWYLHHIFDKLSGGLCAEHNFIYDEFEDTFNNVLLIMFIRPQIQSSHSQIFNQACSNKIAQAVVDMSLIDPKLYFLAINKIRNMISTIYKGIETAIELKYIHGYEYNSNDSDFRSKDTIVLVENIKNDMKYTLSDVNDEDKILNHGISLYNCDYCKVRFYNKHLVAVEYDENLEIIYKKCVNCRTLELSTDYIINFLHQQSLCILQKYLELVRITDHDTEHIILSYLFGTENIRYIDNA